MNGELKTLPLTEFIEMLARRGDGLYLTKDEHGWTVGLIDKADAALMGHAAEWEDIASDILGVRVVAGDEASELREILSRCASAIGNGAAITPSASVEFMAHLPREIELAMTKARDEAAELREENHTLRTEADGWLKRVELLEAAIREWVEATSDAEMFDLDQSNAYGTDHADAEDRVEAAAQALRRLAGGESEK